MQDQVDDHGTRQAAGERGQGAGFFGCNPLAERLLSILVNFGQFCIPLLLLLLPGFPCLGPLLLRLTRLGSVGCIGRSERLSFTPSLDLEHDKVPHKPGLQQADSNKSIQPEEPGVEVASSHVHDLLLHGGLGKTVPESQHCQDN